MFKTEGDDKVRHPDFALRFRQACDSNPLVPPQNHGRLQWIADQLEKRFGVEVTAESVRKWLYGETLPRKKAMAGLAAITGQDEAWLMLGNVPELPKKAAIMRDARADGAVNLVAGLARMDGASPAFPRKGDMFDERHAVDLHLIVQGAHYTCHIANFEREGSGWHGTVPTQSVAEGVTILAVCHVALFQYRIFRLLADDFEDMKPKAGAFEIVIPSDGGAYREVTTFAEPI